MSEKKHVSKRERQQFRIAKAHKRERKRKFKAFLWSFGIIAVLIAGYIALRVL